MTTSYCGGCSTSIDGGNDFILNSHILAKLRKELKNKMSLNTDSNDKESTPGGNLFAGLFGSLNDYGNPFHKAARDVAEIPGNILNGPLLAKKYDMEKVE